MGIIIAAVVLLAETWAAANAARANWLHTSSMNLVIGSALVGIGLTIPLVVAASIAFDPPLVLGLEPKECRSWP